MKNGSQSVPADETPVAHFLTETFPDGPTKWPTLTYLRERGQEKDSYMRTALFPSN